MPSITGIFDKILQELPMIQRAASCLAEVIVQDKLVHVVGPGGHANIAVEEVFWRAGSLAPVNAILDPGINLIHGAKTIESYRANSGLWSQSPGCVSDRQSPRRGSHYRQCVWH